jgi:hypothetical protein
MTAWCAFNTILTVIDDLVVILIVVFPQGNKFIEIHDYRSIGFVMCSLCNWKNTSSECFFMGSTEQVSVNVILGSTITFE